MATSELLQVTDRIKLRRDKILKENILKLIRYELTVDDV